MNRRSFIAGLTGLLVAPAIVRASSLMPVSVVKPGIENTIYVYNFRANVWKRMAMGEFLRLQDYRAGLGGPAMAVRHVFGPPVDVAIFPEGWRR